MTYERTEKLFLNQYENSEVKTFKMDKHTNASTPPTAAMASRFLSSKDKFHRAPAASCLLMRAKQHDPLRNHPNTSLLKAASEK